MYDHSIFVRRSAYIDTSIVSLSVVNIKTILPHGGASLREGGWVHLTSGAGLPSRLRYILFLFPKSQLLVLVEIWGTLENLSVKKYKYRLLLDEFKAFLSETLYHFENGVKYFHHL